MADENGCAPLHLASAYGLAATAKTLLAGGANINEPTLGGYTPLRLAVIHRKPDTVALLVEQGAEINVVGGLNRWTPTGEASARGKQTAANVYREILEYLRSHGGKTQDELNEGRTKP